MARPTARWESQSPPARWARSRSAAATSRSRCTRFRSPEAGASGHLREEFAHAARVRAEIALAHARDAAHVDAAARALGAHADHDVVLEAEPARGVGGLDAAGG